jgi:hypothetical protein
VPSKHHGLVVHGVACDGGNGTNKELPKQVPLLVACVRRRRTPAHVKTTRIQQHCASENVAVIVMRCSTEIEIYCMGRGNAAGTLLARYLSQVSS